MPLTARRLTANSAEIYDIPAPQTAPITAGAGELVEIVLLGNGSGSSVEPVDVPGLEWIEIAAGSAGDECGGIWAAIASEDVEGVPVPISYTSAERVSWIVTARNGYDDTAGEASAYAQALFTRGTGTRTFSALGDPANLAMAVGGAFGPNTMTIGIASDHDEVARISALPDGNRLQAVQLEGSELEVEFSISGAWLATIIVSAELVEGEGGGSGGGGDEDDGLGPRRDAAVWFNSGHSLLDEPLNQYVALLADSAGLSFDWQRQYSIGSPIRYRTAASEEPPFEAWAGYRLGDNRSGSNLDLVEHFRDVAAVGGKTTADPYTDLVIGEGHDLIVTLEGLQTVELLRHYYELVREGSPAARGYFYSTWLDYDAGDIPGWVAYARATDTAHAAVVSRINASLELEERADRLMLLPACGALAELVDRATTGTVPGITQGTLQDTLDVVFADSVHLTPVGVYLLACVVYGALYRRDPRGLVYPGTVTATQAESLQGIAWDILEATYGAAPHLGPQLSAEDAQQAIVDYVPVFAEFYSGSLDVPATEAYFAGTSSAMHFDELDDDIWYAPPGNAVMATGTTAGAPALGAAVVALAYALTASGIAAGAPLPGSPAVSVESRVAAQSVSAGSPELGAAGFAVAHRVAAQGITSGIPVSGTASALAPGHHEIEALGVVTDLPALGAATVSSGDPEHSLAPPARRAPAGVESRFSLDPAEVLDYSIDWTRALAGDEIVAASWFASGTGLAIRDGAQAPTHDERTATVWLSGGVLDQRYRVTCRVTTAGGRTFEASFTIRSVDK